MIFNNHLCDELPSYTTKTSQNKKEIANTISFCESKIKSNNQQNSFLQSYIDQDDPQMLKRYDRKPPEILDL